MKPLQLSDFTVDPENENIHYATFSNKGFIIEVELVHENWDFNKVFELCTSVFENFDQLDNKAKSFLTTIQVKIINEQEELKKNNLVVIEEDFEKLMTIAKIEIYDQKIEFDYIVSVENFLIGAAMLAENGLDNPKFTYVLIESEIEDIDENGNKTFKIIDKKFYRLTEEKSKNSTSSSNNFLQVYNNKNFFERIVSFFKGLFK
ncbi:hypothetical protein [Capnocytophaga sputigena]|uniref:Uncharacterized protein n=1 Tax=Capnocytophaga sputigena TaxID=1019 RepID=A0AAX2IEJ4_CAPSP|nr:hypothetical protein [Capnocytophaga sputigena]ATA83593.1 hypothetical protein CGC55_03285 [Capnocytophaga sputigena]EEB66135.1 hypothetical protein CAPSP0001_1304 [Capnocytophaga sputigena ATCC 33612]SQA76755.1 Uncharacterised protein [Capnocytophaga sputigena]